MKKKKSVLKIILIIVLATLLFLTAIIGIFIYTIDFKKTTIDEYKTPDEKYTLRIEQIGEPDWPFGYTHCRFVLKEGEDVITNYAFDLADDGANASFSNFEVYMLKDYVLVYASASEQGVAEYDLYYDGTVKLDQNSRKTDSTGNMVEKQSLGADDNFYDSDSVWIGYEDQRIKQEYEAIFEYLTTNGSLKDTSDLTNANVKLQYYYSAKGEERVVTCEYQTEQNGEVIYVEQELRYNKTVDGEDEFVYQENYRDEAGNEANSSKILDFFMVNNDTLEVTDTGRTYW